MLIHTCTCTEKEHRVQEEDQEDQEVDWKRERERGRERKNSCCCCRSTGVWTSFEHLPVQIDYPGGNRLRPPARPPYPYYPAVTTTSTSFSALVFFVAVICVFRDGD